MQRFRQGWDKFTITYLKKRISVQGQACFTCSDCCPIVSGNDVFDPQRIIRMTNLGLTDKLLSSPFIWLCLGCQRCADACSQNVSGHTIIRRLQMQAME